MLKRRALFLIAFLCAAVFAIAGANYFFLQRLMAEVEQSDPRNAGIDVVVHYRHYVDIGTLVYDLKELPAGTRPDDIERILQQFASRLGERSFGEVRLAYAGHEKFLLTGDTFRDLGQRAETLRTLPNKLATLDGAPAFLGMRDGATAWHRAWYIDALTEKIRAAMEQAA